MDVLVLHLQRCYCTRLTQYSITPAPGVIHQCCMTVSRKELCALLTTCFNENVLQYLKSFQSRLLFMTGDIFMTVIFDEKCATRIT